LESKSALQPGGKSPIIVFPDADVGAAISGT
jgi:acyl-CoA reductase-like NAD-dependent aldehyde dehydrogenase